MEQKQSNNSSVITWVVIGVIVIGGLYLFQQRQERKECEARANAAAVETYDMSSYPNTAQRGQLQAQYEQSYINSSCR